MTSVWDLEGGNETAARFKVDIRSGAAAAHLGADVLAHPGRQGAEVSSSCAQSCLTLCHPKDCSLPGSSPFSRQEYWSRLSFPSPGDFPQPRTWSWVSCTAGRLFIVWATGEAQQYTIVNEAKFTGVDSIRNSGFSTLNIVARSGSNSLLSWPQRWISESWGGMTQGKMPMKWKG